MARPQRPFGEPDKVADIFKQAGDAEREMGSSSEDIPAGVFEEPAPSRPQAPKEDKPAITAQKAPELPDESLERIQERRRALKIISETNYRAYKNAQEALPHLPGIEVLSKKTVASGKLTPLPKPLAQEQGLLLSNARSVMLTAAAIEYATGETSDTVRREAEAAYVVALPDQSQAQDWAKNDNQVIREIVKQEIGEKQKNHETQEQRKKEYRHSRASYELSQMGGYMKKLEADRKLETQVEEPRR